MELERRLQSYRAIEEYRRKPLVVYATSTRENGGAMMASDAVRELIDQVDALGGHRAVDILIHSSGGDPLAAWKLMSILRERFGQVSVLVPFMAFSAATLFALGANEIVMHPHASLGPIDPQIQVLMPDGSRRGFSYEDVGAFLRFLQEEAKISEQSFTQPLIDRLFTTVDPVNLGGAKRASELSTTVGERLLRTHMKGADETNRARRIAENLNKSFFAHGDAVSRSRARELDLQVAEDDPKLEALLWTAYLGIESHMQLRKPFSPLQIFLEDPRGAAALTPCAPFTMPPNTPPQLVDQVWSQLTQQAVARLGNPAVEIEYLQINAVVESVRLASEHSTAGRIAATHAVGGDIQLSVVVTSGGWHECSIPDVSESNRDERQDG